MKKLFCLLMCAVMILSTAACGKEQEETTLPPETAAATESAVAADTEPAPPETTVPETTVPETTEPETTEPETTTAAATTDRNAKPEDVLKAAAEALMAEDALFAFSADPVLDLSLFYEAPEQETGEGETEAGTNMMQMIIESVAAMLFDDSGKLNIRLELKSYGLYEAGKGVAAEIEFRNNLADKIRALMTLMAGAESANDPSVAWIKDVIKTSLFADLTKKIVYFLNPVSGAWNYTKLNDDPETETETETAEPAEPAVPEEIDLDQLFEEYEWTVTDDQYILSGKVNAEGMSGNSGAADQLPEEAEMRLTMVFNDEQKLVGVELVTEPFGMDLSEMIQGFSFKLDQFSLKAAIEYDTPESFAVPAEIVKNAVEFEGDIPFISGEEDETEEGISIQY